MTIISYPCQFRARCSLLSPFLMPFELIKMLLKNLVVTSFPSFSTPNCTHPVTQFSWNSSEMRLQLQLQLQPPKKLLSISNREMEPGKKMANSPSTQCLSTFTTVFLVPKKIWISKPEKISLHSPASGRVLLFVWGSLMRLLLLLLLLNLNDLSVQNYIFKCFGSRTNYSIHSACILFNWVDDWLPDICVLTKEMPETDSLWRNPCILTRLNFF